MQCPKAVLAKNDPGDAEKGRLMLSNFKIT